MSTGTKSGYSYSYTQDTTYTPSLAYTLHGNPTMFGITGVQSYFIDQTNVIRYSATGATNADSPV